MAAEYQYIRIFAVGGAGGRDCIGEIFPHDGGFRIRGYTDTKHGEPLMRSCAGYHYPSLRAARRAANQATGLDDFSSPSLEFDEEFLD